MTLARRRNASGASRASRRDGGEAGEKFEWASGARHGRDFTGEQILPVLAGIFTWGMVPARAPPRDAGFECPHRLPPSFGGSLDTPEDASDGPDPCGGPRVR